MSINDYMKKFHIHEFFIKILNDLGIKNTEIKFEFQTSLFDEIASLEEKKINLIRAEKKFYGINFLLKKLYHLAETGDTTIWISSFSTDKYGGRLYRTEYMGIGLFVIEKGFKFETPRSWDGTMEMLLKYNGK